MAENFVIAPARSDDDIAAVRALFEGYAASLPIDLAYQGFPAELAGLPGRYAPPEGELLLARDDRGAPLGCVALRPTGREGVCEMKRLFLLPRARGTGLGRALTEAIIAAARALGCAELQLDTLPSMTAAVALYERLGFKRVGAYYGPIPDGTSFFSLKL